MEKAYIDLRKPIEIRQLGWGARAFEFWVDDRRIARLTWPKCLSDYARGFWGRERWGFDRPGFFRDTVELYGQGEDRFALLHYDWLKEGTLHLADGRKHHWQKTRVFREAWALTDELGRVVFEIETWLHWFKRKGEILFGEAAKDTPELAGLVLMGWYLAFKHTEDVAAVVAATVVV